MEKGDWDGPIKEAVLASWRGEERESGRLSIMGKDLPTWVLHWNPVLTWV